MAAAFVALLPGWAGAAEEEAGDGLAEVRVTAQKVEQSVLNVPISMTVLDSKELDALRVQGVEDYIFTIPNVTFYKTSNYDVGVSIRGISGKTGGRFDPVGITIDDVSFGSTDTAPILNARFLDIERIEVLRGPQGTLNANNSMGGSINIITAKPTTDGFAYRATLDYSRFDTTLAKLMLNTPISDTLALRTVIYGENSEGAVKNVGPAGGSSSENNLGGRIAALWTPADRLEVNASFAYERQHLGLEDQLYENLYPSAALRTAAIAQLTALGGNYNASDFIESAGTNGGDVRFDVPEFTDIEDWYGAARATYDLGTYKVDLLYSHYSYDLDNLIDSDKSEYAGQKYERHEGIKADGAELRVASSYHGPFNWVGGLAYDNETNPITNIAYNGDHALGGSYPFYWFKFAQYQSIRSDAVFANAFWDITGRIHASVGARYSSVSTEYGSICCGVDFATPLAPLDLIGSDLKVFSPRATLNFDITSHSTVYVQYATGFRAGFGNDGRATGVHPTTIGTVDVPANVKQETVKNYEVGLKGSYLDNHLTLTADVFYMDYTDLQVQAGNVLDEDTALAFNLNAGKAFSRGFEVEAAARPVTGVTVHASAGYVDAKLQELNGASVNEDIPAVRPWTAHAAFEYEHPLISGLSGNFRADYNWQSQAYTTLARDDADQLTRMSVTNLTVGVAANRWTASLYFDNVFDDNYWIGSLGGSSLRGGLATFVPRTYGVRFTLQTGR